MSDRFGWDITPVTASVKQGSQGSILLTATVTNADGSALSSYSGWTAELMLFRTPQADAPELTLTPTVTGDAPNKQFQILVTLTENDTKTKNVGDLSGDIRMLSPTGENYYPANITLTIERTYTAAA